MLDFKLLKKLYSINSYSGEEQEMQDFLINHLKSHYTGLKIRKDNWGNIYVIKGKAKEYPCVVSHQDQVQQKPKNELIIIQKNKIISAYDSVTGKQCGLGADDKNGIWIALMLLKTEPILKCAFFVQEEVGCVGSRNCDMNFFKDAKYVLQCDRKGKGDIIYETYSTDLCNYDFLPDDLLQKYGYFPNYGLMTDVETLKERGLGVACCNMSCGYYNPHTSYETTNINDLINCLNFVKEIISITPLTKHTYDSTTHYKSLYRNYGGYYGYESYNYGNSVYSHSYASNSKEPSKSVQKYYDWDLYDGYGYYDRELFM